MLPSYAKLRACLCAMIEDKAEQGHDTTGLVERLAAIEDDYEALARFGRGLTHLPMREGWAFEEPSDFPAIRAACDWTSPGTSDSPTFLKRAEERVSAGFLARVCGCVLGKPVEIQTTMEVLRAAFQRIDEWPVADYVSERLQTDGGLERLHGSWTQSCRERLTRVPADDDLNYTILGMLTLERHGLSFTQADLVDLWVNALPLRWTFGPERTTLVKVGQALIGPSLEHFDPARLADEFNPGEELCGAMIRADAYGYACPGRPDLAAELAWRDAHLTHRGNGIYGTMFAAAAIATAFIEPDPLRIFEIALRFVPEKSRFHHIVADSLEEVAAARDWEDGYARIHGKYAEYTHCRVFQESGTLINTLRFAASTGHGICLQVMQGNDTDSYGATAGSLLGIHFGVAGLEPRWLEPFNNNITTRLAGFDAQDLDALATRMGKLVYIGGVR